MSKTKLSSCHCTVGGQRGFVKGHIFMLFKVLDMRQREGESGDAQDIQRLRRTPVCNTREVCNTRMVKYIIYKKIIRNLPNKNTRQCSASERYRCLCGSEHHIPQLIYKTFKSLTLGCRKYIRKFSKSYQLTDPLCLCLLPGKSGAA